MSYVVAAILARMRYVRRMTSEADGWPRIADSARGLGIRVPTDIEPDERGVVAPGTGGLSIASGSMWNLPHHRRPRRLARGSAGPDGDRVYAIDETTIHEPLAVKPDPRAPQIHSFIEPAHPILSDAYTSRIRATRTSWMVVEP